MDEKTTGQEGAQNPPPTDDRIKNLQAEMDRKLGNIHAELQKSQQQLMAQLQSWTPPVKQPVKEDDNLSDLLYKDPEKYTKTIEERVERRVASAQATREQAMAEQNKVLSAMVVEYPELTSTSDPLTKLSNEKFLAMTDKERQSPMALKAAIAEAALDLGVRPKSKRQASTEEDAFALGGGSGGKSEARTKKTADDKKIDELSALFGIDSAKVKARAQARKTFTKWE